MLHRIATLGVVAAVALGGSAIAVAGNSWSGSKSNRAGAKCVQAGVSFLIKNNLLVAAAEGKVDYDTIDSDTAPFTSGLINANLPSPAFLPLGDVIKLHYTNPELFDWCGKRGGDDDDD